MRKWLPLVFLVLFALGCQSMQETVMVDSVDEIDQTLLEETELILIRYRLYGDTAELGRAKQRIDHLLSKGVLNKDFQTKLLCIEGEWFYLSGERTEIKTSIKNAQSLRPLEERITLLESFLLSEQEDKLILLEEYLEQEGGTRLYLDLGDLYFDANQYSKAVAAYDRAIMSLPDSYGILYTNKREVAYNLINSERVGDFDLALKEQLTVNEALTYLVSMGLFDEFWDSTFESSQILSKVRGAGYLSKEATSGTDKLKRGEFAYLLSHSVAWYEDDLYLLSEYAEYYNGMESPIADITPYDLWFNGILMMVEMEFLELRDGENFFPHKSVTGLEMTQAVENIKDLYQ